MNDKNISSRMMAIVLAVATNAPLPSLASTSTHDKDPSRAYRFTAPLGMAGSGCKAQEVPLNVNAPFVELPAYKTDGKSRVGCSFAIPLQVAAGYQVAVKAVRYSGKTSGNGVFRYKAFFAGMPERGFIERLPQVMHGREYYHIDEIEEPLWSVCSRSVNLRFNTSLRTSVQTDSVSLTTLSFELAQRA